MLDTCLGCGEALDGDRACPDCGWTLDSFRERDRHGLAKPGHSEPEEGEGDRDGPDGPPPGPRSVLGF